MKTSDFNVKAIPQNFKDLVADKKQLVFECIRIGIMFFFLILVFIPFFTLRETGVGVIAHFTINNQSGLFAFILMFTWSLLTFIIFPLSLVTPFKKYSNFILLGVAGIETLYWLITVIVYLVNLVQVKDLNIPTWKLPLNIGFWFIFIHIGLVVLITLLPRPFKKLADKIVIAGSPMNTAPLNSEYYTEPSMKTAAKIFLIIGMVFAFYLIFPVVLGLKAIRKLDEGASKEDLQLWGILSIFFVSTIGGILMLLLKIKGPVVIENVVKPDIQQESQQPKEPTSKEPVAEEKPTEPEVKEEPPVVEEPKPKTTRKPKPKPEEAKE